MVETLIDVNLFGACSVAATREGGYNLSGAKHRAVFALLATAPFGRRSRSFLQETLWGTSCYDTGRQSLRRALADIKQIMGPDYPLVLSGNNSELTLDLSRVRFSGHPAAGPFLEGLDVREPGFVEWITSIRRNPRQLSALFSLTSQATAMRILPVVAVMPFRAIGGEPTDSVMGDWLAEEVCRSLSRSRLLAVISHLSCRELSSTSIDLGTVQARFQADFCVAGTLRRCNNGKLVLDADFVDVRSGRIVWTRQFIESAARFIEASDAGIGEIVSAVGGAIADEALAHVRGRAPVEIEDHRLLIAGVSLMHRSTLRDFARSRELIDEAARRAPDSPEVLAWLGKWYVLSVFNGWSSDVSRETRRAVEYTARALDLAPDNAFALTIDGFAHNNLLRRLDVAERRYDAALSSSPSSALSWLLKGVLHAFRDQGTQAVQATTAARQLSPLDPFGYFYDTLNATAHLAQQDYEQALALAERSLAMNDRHLSTLRTKIVALHHLGRGELARQAGRELLRRQPDFTVDGYLKIHPAADFNFGRQAAAALRAANIP